MTGAALVTGAGSGIGAAIARKLAADGFAVAVLDVRVDAAQVVADSISATGAKAIALAADVSKKQEVEDAVDAAVRELGELRVMVNNAAIGPAISLLDSTERDFDTIMHVNVLSVLWGIQASARVFRAQGGGGKIINAVSQAGHRGDAFVPLYATSKFAVRGLTQSAAMALAPEGITVNGYCPGLVDTPMWHGIAGRLAQSEGRDVAEVLAEQEGRIALGRYQQPEDVAAFVSFLASPASDYMTGQSVLIDGGMVYV